MFMGGKSCFIYVLLESSCGTEVMFISASKMSHGDILNILALDLCEQ